jgi:hypothetical protein
MKQNHNVISFILAAAVTLGLAASASAQNANVAVPTPTESTVTSGLLGSRYTQISANYIDLTAGNPSVARGFQFDYNQPLQANVDLNLGYDWARAHYAGARLTQQDVGVGATAYTNLSWGRPFALAAVGWQWQKGAGVSEDSFTYKVGVGTEFKVAPAVVVTPFVNFVRATGFNDSEVDFGVKAAYRITKDWSLTARAQYDAVRHYKDSAEYSVGAAYHF